VTTSTCGRACRRVRQQAAEVEQTPTRLNINEKVHVASRCRIAARHRAEDAHIRSPALGGKAHNRGSLKAEFGEAQRLRLSSDDHHSFTIVTRGGRLRPVGTDRPVIGDPAEQTVPPSTWPAAAPPSPCWARSRRPLRRRGRQRAHHRRAAASRTDAARAHRRSGRRRAFQPGGRRQRPTHARGIRARRGALTQRTQERPRHRLSEPWTYVVTPPARRDLRRLNPPVQRRITSTLTASSPTRSPATSDA
jgi:hypothetical protein